MGPAGVVMGMVRVLALGAVGYLLVVVSLELAGRWSAVPALLRTSRRLCLPGMAGWLSQAAAAGLVVSMVAGSVLTAGAAGAATQPSGMVVVMHELPPTTVTAPVSTATPSGTRLEPSGSTRADAPPVMRVVGSPPMSGPPRSGPPTITPPTGPPPPSTAPVPTADPGADLPTSGVPVLGSSPGTWTIRPGDHLWRVASVTLNGRWEARPTDAQVLDYLHELISANRERLVVSTDPDLVYPGQVFVLPPVPARPA